MGNRKVTVQNREIYHRSHSPKVYQFLPFGLAVAPQVFTRVFQTVIAHLHTLSIQAHSFLDDSLLKKFDSEILEIGKPCCSRQIGEISWKPKKWGYGNKHSKGPVWWSTYLEEYKL
jgi:hypothetical protein